jgi:transcriptional regulator GlxA family with amidase domain
MTTDPRRPTIMLRKRHCYNHAVKMSLFGVPICHMDDFVIVVPEGALGAVIGCTLDTLGVADRVARSLGWPHISWSVVGRKNSTLLSNGMLVKTKPLSRAELSECAVMIFPGLGLDHSELGLDLEGGIDERYEEQVVMQRMAMTDSRLFARLAADHYDRGGMIAASCSGVLIFAMAGLLDGRAATTHWRLTTFFKRHFPRTRLDTNRMVTDDKGIVSAGAAMAQMDLMLYLISQRIRPDVADLTMRYLLIDDRATQARYRVWDSLRNDAMHTVSSFRALIEGSLPQIVTVKEAARVLNVTERTLARRVFKATGGSPLDLIQALRMDVAQRLLSITDLPLDEVAQRVGYANASSLRKLTIKMAHLPPASLRLRLHVGRTETSFAQKPLSRV